MERIDNSLTPRGVDRRTAARRNEDMYGVADMEAIAADVTLRLTKDESSMALMVVAMLADAQEELKNDPSRACQTLNRIKFLILRCCPMPNPCADETTMQHDIAA